MPQDENKPFIDRRKKKKDWVAYAVSIFSGLAWAAAVVILALLERARPKQESIFSRLFMDTPVVSAWNSGLLRMVLVLMICVLVVCIVGILFSATRIRRRGDRINLSIVTLAVATAVGIALFLYQFSRYL